MKIPIVNEDDEIIGFMERNEMNSSAIYRISALWITNSKGNILLARRALTKKHSPGKWGPAVAGTVEEGETYESNIIKEAEEELGLKNIKPILGPKIRQKTKWNYFCQWFTLVLDKEISEFNIAKDEVAKIGWFTKEELVREFKNNSDEFLSNILDNLNFFSNEIKS